MLRRVSPLLPSVRSAPVRVCLLPAWLLLLLLLLTTRTDGPTAGHRENQTKGRSGSGRSTRDKGEKKDNWRGTAKTRKEHSCAATSLPPSPPARCVQAPDGPLGRGHSALRLTD
jgi:hypothetical protein